MAKKYDVIVVGGGISGTITAAYLAKSGRKVALLEATDQIGGPYWGAYTRPGGYKTEYTSHLPAWFAFSNGGGGYWSKAANEVGANIQWVVMPNNATWAYKTMKEPVILPICSTGDAFVEFYQKLIPQPLPESTKFGLSRLFESMKAMSPEQRWGEKADETPAIEWIRGVTQDEGAIYCMARVAAFTGAETASALEKTSIALFSATFGLYSGAFFLTAIQGDTSCKIPQEFARVARENGADILLSSTAHEVIVENGAARGVRVAAKNGEFTLEADTVVISTFWNQYRRLLGSHIPSGYEATLAQFDSNRRVTIDIHYGLNKDIVKYPNWANVMLLDDNYEYDFMIAVPSFYNNAFAPQGKQLIQIECYRNHDVFKAKPLDDWVAHIEGVCESLYPGWLAAVDFREVIVRSPILNHEYLAVRKFPAKHPDVEGIYFTGDSTYGPTMVTEQAAATAMRVKDMILGNPVVNRF